MKPSFYRWAFLATFQTITLSWRPHCVLSSSRKLVKHLANICVMDDERVGHRPMGYAVPDQVHLAFTLKIEVLFYFILSFKGVGGENDNDSFTRLTNLTFHQLFPYIPNLSKYSFPSFVYLCVLVIAMLPHYSLMKRDKLPWIKTALFWQSFHYQSV